MNHLLVRGVGVLWVLTATPVAFAQERVVTAGQDGVLAPKRTRTVNPVYPQEAQAQGIRGIVILEVLIDPQGKVASAQIIRSIPGLDEAALEAVRKWEYAVTKVDGQPVSVKLTVPITFAMKVPEVSRAPGTPELRQGALVQFPAGQAEGHRVTAEVTLAADGQVAEAEIVKGDAPFSIALLAALRTWRFAPESDGATLSFRVEADFLPERGDRPRVEVRLTNPRRLEAAAAPSADAPTATPEAAGSTPVPSPPAGPPTTAPTPAESAPVVPLAETPTPSAREVVPTPSTPAGPAPVAAAPAAAAPAAPAPAAPAPVAAPAAAPVAAAPVAAPAAPAPGAPLPAPHASAPASSGAAAPSSPATPAESPAPTAAPPPRMPPPTLAPAAPPAPSPPRPGAPTVAEAKPAAAPPPVEVLTAPRPPAEAPRPVEPGVSAVKDITLALGVPDLVRGRRPVPSPRARMTGTTGKVEVKFGVDAAGATSVKEATGPEVLAAAAVYTVQSWFFRRVTAERLHLVAEFDFLGETAKAAIRPE